MKNLVINRKIALVYPPVSSPWHLPAGISMLSALLREQGHHVVQRYGHILGLEHLLLKHGHAEAEAALFTLRDKQQTPASLFEARQFLEKISASISSDDQFAVQRNNIRYVAHGYEGSAQTLRRCIEGKEKNLWYDYFLNVEVPLAEELQPDIYGISINDERQLVPGCILASLIKDRCPNAQVVLGGNLWPRVKAAYTSEDFQGLFKFWDAIIYSEGFEPILHLAQTMNLETTPGLVWNDGTRVVTNLKPKAAKMFEDLPTPNFDGGATVWSPDNVMSLFTMSNCPQKCSFCAISAGSDTFLAKPRSMSPQRIAAHMKALAPYGNRFDIFDETFSVSRQIKLGEALHQMGHDATWQCYLTVTNDLLRPDRCKALYDAGCRAVQLGLETLSKESLSQEAKVWNDPVSYGQILRNLHEAGIQTHIFIIVGIPGEEMTSTLRWLPFLQDHGEAIFTIKASRYRLTRGSPEEISTALDPRIEPLSDDAPLRLNREFQYRSEEGRSLRKDVEAALTLLEEACRLHWGYAATSTYPWWANRGRYSLEEFRIIADHYEHEPITPHLSRSIKRAANIIKTEMGMDMAFTSFHDVSDFLRFH